jgi:hypothetical protein
MLRGVAATAARGDVPFARPVAARRNAAQVRWLARLGEHQAQVRAWLAARRDPASRGLGATQWEGVRLASRAHALAAQGLVTQVAGEVRCSPPARARVPFLPVAGASDDTQVARLIERAAANQVRALSWVRRARDPSANMAVTLQRREMLLRAIEHIATSRRLLHRAQTLSSDGALADVLTRHLAQLDDAAASVERLVHDLDEAQQA